MRNFQSNPFEVIISEKAIEVIVELIEKYKLKEREEELERKIAQTENISEREKLYDELPLRQLSRIVKNIIREKISVEELPSILKKQLNLSEESAKELANDLKEKVIPLVEKIPTEKEEEIPLPKKRVLKKALEEEKPEEIKKEEIKPERRDIYREPVD